MLTLSSLAMWQANDPLTSHDMHLLMIFAGVIAAALLLQSLVIVGALLAGMKVQKSVVADIEQVKAKVMPLADKSHALVLQISEVAAELTPTIKEIATTVGVVAGHVEHISGILREKAEEFAPTVSAANETFAEANETVRDVNRKTQEQVERVNGMVTSVLDATAQMGHSIKRGMAIPGRELTGLVSGLKAAFDALLQRPKPARYVTAIEFHQPYRSLTPSYRSLSDVPPDVLDEGIPGEPLE